MTVLHVTPCLAPAWAYGRVALDVLSLARAQTAAGHDVIVLTTDALAPHERLLAGDIVQDGVRVIRVRNISGAVRTWLGLSSPFGMRRQARALFHDRAIDIVHAHELRTAENRSVLPELPARVPLVVSPHGTARPGRHRSPVARTWDSLVLDRVLGRATRVVAASDQEAGAVTRLFAERLKPLEDDVVTVVPDGVDLTGVGTSPSRDAARRHFGLQDEPVVLFVGRIDAHAGLVPLVSAFAGVVHGVPQARLFIVGGDHGALEEVRSHVHARGLDSRVRFGGYLGVGAMTMAYAAADLLVLPGAADRARRKTVVHALAAGVPVLVGAGGVCCDCDGEAVRRVGPGESAWADAVLTILANPDVLARARARAPQVAAGQTWPAVASRLQGIYEDVLRREKTGRMSR